MTQETGSRFIVRAAANGASLQSFLASIEGDPAIRLAETIGPAQQPHTAVIETDPGTAQQLAQRFRDTNQLLIEPDWPLSLFAPARNRDRKGIQMPKEPTSGPGTQPEAAGAGPDNAAAAGAESGAGGASAPRQQGVRGHAVGERKKRFLVAPRQPMIQIGPLGVLPMAFQPLQMAAVEQALRANPEIEVVGTVGGPRGAGPLAEGMAGQSEGVLVARMTDSKAQELSIQGQGRLLVERDQHLLLLDPALRQPDLVTAVAPYTGATLSVTVVVADKDGAPVPQAEVSLFGSLLPAIGVTGADGCVTLTMYSENPHTIRGLYVKPRADFWSFYQRDPDIVPDAPNLVTLRPLSEWRSLAGFPAQGTVGWGERAMRLDKLPQGFGGRGVKIAVIDSGAATSHTDLKHVGPGFDIINANPNTWNQDSLGHGSHCTGVIGGADPAFGIRGFAPEAEIQVCKLFPGGQVSQLIEALEYCIEHQIDVVNLSLGGIEPSEALEQQIVRAKRFGVACIAAAGNSGDAVQYPASSPHVLAVAAIGKTGEFPPDSYHREATNGDADAEGFFTARFSCYGPQVDVCAPGVAIVSSVPPNNFAAWDGTSTAAPHITGLAALVLAHHPAFQGPGRAPNADRVERLFQVIRLSARRVTLGAQSRIGYGLPDALVALGFQLMQDRRGAQQPLASLAGMPGMGIGAFGQIGEGGFAQAVGQSLGQSIGLAQLSGIPGLPFGIGGVRGW